MNRGLIYLLLFLVLLIGYYLFRTYRAEQNIEQQLTEISESPASPFRLNHGSVDVSPLSGNLSVTDLEIGSKVNPGNAFNSANITFEIGYGNILDIYLFGIESEIQEINSGTIVFDNLSLGNVNQPWASIRKLTLTQSGELADNIQELIENQWTQHSHALQITLEQIKIDTSLAPPRISKGLILKPTEEDTAAFLLDHINADFELLPSQNKLNVKHITGQREEMEFKLEGYFNFDQDSSQITEPSSFSGKINLTASNDSYYRLSYGPSPEYDYMDLKGLKVDGTLNKDFNTSSQHALPSGVITLDADSARWPIPETIESTYRSFLTLAGWQGDPIPFSDVQIHYTYSEESNSIKLDPASVKTAMGDVILNGTLIPVRNGEQYRWIDTKLTIQDIEPGLQNMVKMAERSFNLKIPIRDDSLSLKLNGSIYSPSVSF